MLEISQIKIPVMPDYTENLKKKTASLISVRPEKFIEFVVYKRSIDARKKPELFYVFTVLVTLSREDEKRVLSNPKIKNVKRAKMIAYQPLRMEKKALRPVVVGAGPAGLFAAYALALAGNPALLIERGRDIESRKQDVENFFSTGLLIPDSNVQFGEGGAGTFSDGKLNTQTHDKLGRNRFVLETFVKFGAQAEILIDPKPHVGTDCLRLVIKNLREELIRLGTEVRFETKLTGLSIENRKLKGITVNGNLDIPCQNLILAIGHSARDTFEMLYTLGVPMQSKAFAVGLRVEHPQDFIDHSQYGRDRDFLPAANYKLATNLENGRGVYSFCMCPGGYVVNASSEEKMTAVNGMSYSGRDSQNANSAIIVSVGENEYALDDPMGAIRFQRELERRTYELGQGKIPQQLFGDYVEGKKSTGYGAISPITKGKTVLSDLTGILPSDVRSSLIEGMKIFDRKIKGFANEEAILSGVESRTSSPVRIHRDENGMSEIRGLYPCGEGAGYAGGITSAAMDGLKMAEALIKNNQETN